MPRLIITEKGSEKETAHELGGRLISIGRHADNTIPLSGNGVSRQHANITIENNNAFLIDLGGGNGTFLNGVKVTPNEKALLRHNDIISIENYNLRFNQIDAMLESSFNEITESDILEVKLLKRVLKAIDKENIPSLEVLNGSFMGKKIFVTDDMDELVIGRDPSCDFQVDEYVISRRHVKLVKKLGGVAIEDLNSKNGTFINGARITSDTIIHDGDRVSLGTIVLIFRNPKDVDIKAIGDKIKKTRAVAVRKATLAAPRPREAPGEETSGQTASEFGEGGELELMPEEELPVNQYPTPIARKELIRFSGFEIGIIGLGVLIFVFAAISLINLISK